MPNQEEPAAEPEPLEAPSQLDVPDNEKGLTE